MLLSFWTHSRFQQGFDSSCELQILDGQKIGFQSNIDFHKSMWCCCCLNHRAPDEISHDTSHQCFNDIRDEGNHWRIRLEELEKQIHLGSNTFEDLKLYFHKLVCAAESKCVIWCVLLWPFTCTELSIMLDYRHNHVPNYQCFHSNIFVFCPTSWAKALSKFLTGIQLNVELAPGWWIVKQFPHGLQHLNK